MRTIYTQQLSPFHSTLHLIMLAHTGQDAADRGVRSVGGIVELLEFLIVGVFDVLRVGKHSANHGRLGDDGLQPLLNGSAADEATLGAILAHVGEIAQQESVAHGGGHQGNDAFTLALLEAQDQVSGLHHGPGEPSGSKTAGIDADAVHDAPSRWVDLVRRQALRPCTRHSYASAAQVSGQQQLAHRGAAYVAGADEHDVHTITSLSCRRLCRW